MPPRSWAQIVRNSTSMKPSPLRQDTTMLATDIPSPPSPEPLTMAAILAKAHDKWPDEAEPQEPHSSTMLDSAKAELKTDSGVAVVVDLSPSSTSRASSSSNNTNTCSSTESAAATPATNQNSTGDKKKMANKKRHDKKVKKAKAKKAMKEAVERPIGAPAPPPSPVAGEKKNKTKKVKEDKGKGIAIDASDSEEEEIVGLPTEAPIEVDAAAAAAAAAAASAAVEAKEKEEEFAKAKRAFEALERDRRRKLFASRGGFDVTLIFGKDKKSALAHREILKADSTWFAEHLPPADEDGQTTLVMEGWTAPRMGPLLSFIYTGALPGMTVDPVRKWDLRFVLFNITNYRTSAHLEIQSGLEHFLGNIKDAVDYYKPLLNGQFYHYKFYKKGSMESLEIPLRMSYINMYEEKEKLAEMRQLKLQVAQLFMAIIPFCLRQPSFKGPIKKYWTSLNFPWREDMKTFYEEGLLNEYAQMFDPKGNWIDEDDPESEAQPDKLGGPGPSSAAPTHYASSIDEMVQKMRDAGVNDF